MCIRDRRIIRQVAATMPEGPINVVDKKGTLPPKEKVLTDMESLIRQFMTTTMGVNAPAGQVYFAAENPKGELGFFLDSKGGGLPNRLRMRSPDVYKRQHQNNSKQLPFPHPFLPPKKKVFILTP